MKISISAYVERTICTVGEGEGRARADRIHILLKGVDRFLEYRNWKRHYGGRSTDAAANVTRQSRCYYANVT